MEKANLTCPHCGHTQEVDIPQNGCLTFHKCEKCQQIISVPKESKHCCVICEYSDKKCPVAVKQGINLNFKINDEHLLIHIINSIEPDRFSSNKYKKDIIAFKNYAWEKSKSCYNLLVGRISVIDLERSRLSKTYRKLPIYIKELINTSLYQKLRQQTENYLQLCQKQWLKNYPTSYAAIKQITALNLSDSFTVFITHPSLKNGKYLGNKVIEWGHSEEFPNYITIYLWHEILHHYMDRDEIEHAIIELITDEELRRRLNGEKYPPFVGHKDLEGVKRKVLPLWKQYLKLRNKDIRQFIKLVKNKIKSET